MPFIVQDEFTDTDGTALQNHTPSIQGGSWAKLYSNHGSQNCVINSNRLRGTGATTYATYYNSSIPNSADYQVYGQFDYVGSIFPENDSWGLIGRATSGILEGQDTYYYVAVNATDATMILVKIVSGTNTQLGSTYNIPGGINTGTQFYVTLDMVGNQISAWHGAVQAIGPITDNSISIVGVGGLYMKTSTATDGAHMDDFYIWNYDPILRPRGPQLAGDRRRNKRRSFWNRK